MPCDKWHRMLNEAVSHLSWSVMPSALALELEKRTAYCIVTYNIRRAPMAFDPLSIGRVAFEIDTHCSTFVRTQIHAADLAYLRIIRSPMTVLHAADLNISHLNGIVCHPHRTPSPRSDAVQSAQRTLGANSCQMLDDTRQSRSRPYLQYVHVLIWRVVRTHIQRLLNSNRVRNSPTESGRAAGTRAA